MCAISARHTFSPTYKTGICIYIPPWPPSEIASRLFASLIPGYCFMCVCVPVCVCVCVCRWGDCTKSPPADTKCHFLFFLPPHFLLECLRGRGQRANHTKTCYLRRVAACCAPTGRERNHRSILKNIRPNQRSFVQGARGTELVAVCADRAAGTRRRCRLFCAGTVCLHTCPPRCFYFINSFIYLNLHCKRWRVPCSSSSGPSSNGQTRQTHSRNASFSANVAPSPSQKQIKMLNRRAGAITQREKRGKVAVDDICNSPAAISGDA